VPQRTVGRQRLLVENIERGAANMALPQNGNQRILIDHGAARDIDQLYERERGGAIRV
jgi:hypothetical protein